MRLTYAATGTPAARPRRKADRGGKNNATDVQALCERYGFRGVEFGNWVTQVERQQSVARVDQGLVRLCEVFGWPEHSFNKIGPNGVALAFGARGKGGRIAGGGSAIAHFEGGQNVVNLTRTKSGMSAAAFVHELGHAIDWHLGDGKRFYSAGPAWQAEIDQMPTYFAYCKHRNMPSRKSGRTDGYWTRPEEIFARSFEVYVRALGYKGSLAAGALGDHPTGDDAEIAVAAIAPLFDSVTADIRGRQ